MIDKLGKLVLKSIQTLYKAIPAKEKLQVVWKKICEKIGGGLS